eukprot:UN21494
MASCERFKIAKIGTTDLKTKVRCCRLEVTVDFFEVLLRHLQKPVLINAFEILSKIFICPVFFSVIVEQLKYPLDHFLL